MLSVLYIGIFSEGSTSKMRAEAILRSKNGVTLEVIDIDIPFHRLNRVFRSIGFRYKIGPAINIINKYILSRISKSNYDIIWVDKAIFLTQDTTKALRKLTPRLIHYTPDTAFIGNYSSHFIKSISLYDYLITTKSFEIEYYQNYVSADKIKFVTQGYDTKTHFPYNSFDDKVDRVTFIGLCEPSREKVIYELINNGIKVTLAGSKWSGFFYKNRKNPNLDYLGNGLFGSDYSKMISQSYFSIGFLSKRFPELHTTRTFEIPACGTALLCERNVETTKYYSEDEVIFYSSTNELIRQIQFFRTNISALREVTAKGMQRVVSNGYNYDDIIRRVFEDIC